MFTQLPNPQRHIRQLLFRQHPRSPFIRLLDQSGLVLGAELVLLHNALNSSFLTALKSHELYMLTLIFDLKVNLHSLNLELLSKVSHMFLDIIALNFENLQGCLCCNP